MHDLNPREYGCVTFFLHQTQFPIHSPDLSASSLFTSTFLLFLFWCS